MKNFMVYFLHIFGILFTLTVCIYSFIILKVLFGIIFLILTFFPIISLRNYISRRKDPKLNIK